jgi:type IX secretion system PorP/SprF family membrane protein
MKNFLLIISIAACLSQTAFSQQLPIYTQYFWNDYAINPAFTGTSKFSPIQVGVRNQWTGFKGAPATYTFGGHTSSNKNNMGFGGMMFLDDMGGAIKQSGIMLNYSYFLKINNQSKLNFGVAGIINQYSYDGTNISAQSTNDVSLFTSSKAIAPDMNLGVAYIYNDRLKIGFSANQLIQYRIKKWNSLNMNIDAQNKLVRHYNFTASYLANVTDKIEIEPYTLLRMTFINPIQFDLGARVIYDKNFFAGLSYRYQDAFSVMIGTTYNRFCFGYSYDITTSAIRKFSSGTHEVVLGYRFDKKGNRTGTFVH